MSAGLLVLFLFILLALGFADKNWLNAPDKIWLRSPGANTVMALNLKRIAKAILLFLSKTKNMDWRLFLRNRSIIPRL